jgi:voltage-gated potassium channel
VSNRHQTLFRILELTFGLLFGVEYAARLWTAAEDPRYGGGWRSPIRWAVSPAALIDLIAILPAYSSQARSPPTSCGYCASCESSESRS